MDSFTVFISPRALRDMKRLPGKIRARIDRAILLLADNPFPPRYTSLHGTALADFRVRVGAYRILYDVYTGKRSVYILRVGHRKDIYR